MRVLLAGFGVVGQALVRLLDERRGELYRRHGLSPRLVGVIDTRGAAVSEAGLDAAALAAAKAAHGTVSAVADHGVRGADVEQLIVESDADVFVLATPSQISAPAAAMGALKAAFRSGKHVISVNKAPLALALPALQELAAYNRREFRFSGTVGAGTPMMALARECARGDEIVGVRAILNGTTNFILSRMRNDGQEFAAALAEAQRLGYAETDPSTDIDGVDTATKIAIFANHVLGRPCRLSDVSIAGIRDLPLERVRAAAQRGNTLKLIGEIGESLSVSPQETPAHGPLDVPANLNALTLTLRRGGDVTLVGRGAGGVETACAVLRDLLDIWETMGTSA